MSEVHWHFLPAFYARNRTNTACGLPVSHEGKEGCIPVGKVVGPGLKDTGKVTCGSCAAYLLGKSELKRHLTPVQRKALLGHVDPFA